MVDALWRSRGPSPERSNEGPSARSRLRLVLRRILPACVCGSKRLRVHDAMATGSSQGSSECGSMRHCALQLCSHSQEAARRAVHRRCKRTADCPPFPGCACTSVPACTSMAPPPRVTSPCHHRISLPRHPHCYLAIRLLPRLVAVARDPIVVLQFHIPAIAPPPPTLVLALCPSDPSTSPASYRRRYHHSRYTPSPTT